MTYLLTEQMMNGTVTIQISNRGIEADNFEEAKEKVKALLKKNLPIAEIDEDCEELFCYHTFDLYGWIKNDPLKYVEVT